MRKTRIIARVALALAAAATMIGTAAATPPPDHKVTLCHRTGSATNPYVEITVDIASTAQAETARGHDSHDQIGNGLGGDIIPAYTYTAKDGTVTNYQGKNLADSDILANGCEVSVEPSPSPTPTETPPPSPTGTPPVPPPPGGTHWHRRNLAFTGLREWALGLLALGFAVLGIAALRLARKKG